MKNFSLRMGAAIVATAALAGCGRSTATPEDLARTVVSYLAAGDFDGYLENTVMTPEQGFEVCPSAEKFELDVPDFRDEFEDCIKAFDFSTAEVTKVDPDLETFKASTKDCGNKEPLNTADKIEITVTGDRGTFKFRLRDVFETLDGWRQTNDMSCSVAIEGFGGAGGSGP